MNNPKVSIIMPVYNAEAFLHRSIGSIIAQTMTDWELLVIDDGSKDSSGGICDNIAHEDSRIRVIHKKNGGVSAARQTGTDAARGEYIIHADADDWVEKDMLEALCVKAETEGADVVICDFFSNVGDKQEYVVQQPSSLNAETVLRELFQQLHGSCWNKLIRRACYTRNDVRFPVGINHCEDLLVWVQLFQHPLKIAYVPRAFYHYVQNAASITHHFTRSTYNMRRAFLHELCRLLPVQGFEAEKRSARLGVLVEGYMFGVVSNSEAWTELVRHNWRAAFCDKASLRWRAGYICLALGLFPLSKNLLKY